jgi:PEP-CTERM motif
MTQAYPTNVPRHHLRRSVHIGTAFALLAMASAARAALPPFASFTAIGNVSNYSYPETWEHHTLDVTSLLPGAASAQLSFDFTNTQFVPGTTYTPAGTNAHLYFASDSAGYYLNFEFFRPLNDIFANSSSHLRDVKLTIDGSTFVDQYGAFSNHLGDPLRGTAGDGDIEGYNILGQTGFIATTYVLTAAVPEPGTVALWSAGIGLMLFRWRRAAVALL